MNDLDRCESCGYTESHDPNCPRDKVVARFFDAFKEEAQALVHQKVLSRQDASDIASAFARIAASLRPEGALILATEKGLTPLGICINALQEIAKGEGAFSRDRLQHATNTIEDMKRIATVTLDQLLPQPHTPEEKL